MGKKKWIKPNPTTPFKGKRYGRRRSRLNLSTIRMKTYRFCEVKADGNVVLEHPVRGRNEYKPTVPHKKFICPETEMGLFMRPAFWSITGRDFNYRLCYEVIRNEIEAVYGRAFTTKWLQIISLRISPKYREMVMPS